MPQQPLHRGCGEQILGIFQTPSNAFPSLTQYQCQIELRLRKLATEPAQLNPGHVQLSLRRVLPRQLHLKQRCPVQTALWFQLFRSEEHTSELQSQSNLVC